MTRFRFGGDAAAWLVELVTNAALYSGAEVVALPTADTTVPFYRAQNTTALTDFLDSTGSPISSIIVPAGSPYLPFFFGPLDLTTLWFQDTNAAWHVLLPSDLGDRTAAAESNILTLQSDVTALQAGGGGGGGGAGVNFVYQSAPGTAGWPARPDLTTPTFWRGPDQPPLGVSAGAQYMMPGDEWEETSALVVIA